MERGALAWIRIGDNALAPEDGTQYRLHEKNLLNAPLDTVANLIVEVINAILEKFYPELAISADAPKIVDVQTGIAERKIQVQPADLLTPELQDTLLKTMKMLVEGLVPGAGNLHPASTEAALTPDRMEFVNEKLSKLIERQGGKSIPKPGIVTLQWSNGTTLDLPIQGAFAPPPNLPGDSSQPVEVLAKADGFKASSMQVFLRLVDEAGLTLMGASVICLADKSSQIQLAAQAFLDDNMLLKATIAEIKGKKGKKSGPQYNIKDLKTIPLDQLSKEGELQFKAAGELDEYVYVPDSPK